MLRYCITDSLEIATRAASNGAHMIQLRAKNLPTRDLLKLAQSAVNSIKIPILVNTRLDVALACEAQGVHLPAGSIAPSAIRKITPAGFLIGVSCHTIQELQTAE